MAAAVVGMALAAVALGTAGQRLVEPGVQDIVTLDEQHAVTANAAVLGESVELRPFGRPRDVDESSGDLVVDLDDADALAAGPLPAESDGDDVFLVPPEGFAALPTALTAALVLFVLAYAESLLRGVRRRRRARPADVVGMTLVGLLGGVAVLAVGWVFGDGWAVARVVVGEGPGLVLTVAVLALSALAGAGLVPLAAQRAARRRRTAA